MSEYFYQYISDGLNCVQQAFLLLPHIPPGRQLLRWVRGLTYVLLMGSQVAHVTRSLGFKWQGFSG